jgi:hypothetical protein
VWDELKKKAAPFNSAVLSARDAEGYPASVRTAFAFDDAERALRVHPAADLALEPGPASLLFHSHDERLWGLQIVPVRGELALSAGGWVFRPRKFAADGTGGLAVLRMLLNCRKAAKAYLCKRGLARPAVPWARLKELKGEAGHK